VSIDAEWEQEAANWVRWARTPGFDAYWYFRESFFDSIMPAHSGRTLEVGCGEGRVTRDLTARGHTVVAVEPAATLAGYAKAEDTRGAYVVAAGNALPFPASTFDVVVAYNALQVVNDMAGTVQEVARVLASGGSLCACVAHPATDLGRFTDGTDGAGPQLVVRDGYLETRRVEDRVEVDGHAMTFRGWTYSLEHYSRALEGAGLTINAIREPKPARAGERYERWQRVPLFLNFRATK
jgi:SAM-dependent methyltransferase